MIVWGIIALILLLIVIGLVIWLLVRGTPQKAGVNQACTTNSDCSGGLVCSTTGVLGTTGLAPGARVCKVANGQVCVANTDCASGSVCRNGVCSTSLGTQGGACPCDNGFTCVNSVCRAIVGQRCTSNTDCSTGNCINNICMPTGMTGMTGATGCWNDTSCFDTSDFDHHRRRRHCDSSDETSDFDHRRRRHSSDETSDFDHRRRRHSSEDCSRNTSEESKRKDSSDWSKHSRDSDSRRLSSDFTSCSKSNCNDTKFSIISSSNSEDSRKCNLKGSDKNEEISLFSSCCESSDERGIRRGVYKTNQNNQDQTLFTAIDQPIIDIAKTDKIYLLLKNGNIAANMGINNVIYNTDRKMIRMVRFGNDIVGLDKNGKLYYASKSGSNNWSWIYLKNFPSDVVFINSTNNPSNRLEVMTSRNKAYLFSYSANWKEGNKTSSRHTKDPRFYGKDVNRYIDIDEPTNIGKTNEGMKVKHVKAAGFFANNNLVAVLTSDCFTHVRIIDNNAYFLFEQR